MVYILMGVSGCGKTTVGKKLAGKLNLSFYDADDFHPEKNVKKMESGIPLNDDDRYPWLEILLENIARWNKSKGAVLACSALKKSYRDHLRKDNNGSVSFIYLKGAKELIYDRLKNREEHYMPSSLLDSQFETLEEPEDALTITVDSDPENIIKEIMKQLRL
jgi:carbohydrate kinase (thermoresistant glucokinase family)